MTVTVDDTLAVMQPLDVPVTVLHTLPEFVAVAQMVGETDEVAVSEMDAVGARDKEGEPVTQDDADAQDDTLELPVKLDEPHALFVKTGVEQDVELAEWHGEAELERQAVLETDSVPVLHTVTETLVVEDVVGDATLLLLLLALIDTVGLDDDDAEGLFEGVWVAQALDVVVGQ